MTTYCWLLSDFLALTARIDRTNSQHHAGRDWLLGGTGLKQWQGFVLQSGSVRSFKLR